MKILKKSIALIVVFVAVCITISAQRGIFEQKLLRSDSDCFSPNMYVMDVFCTGGESELLSSTLCLNVIPGTHVFGIDPFNYMLNPVENCPGGSKFCCAYVEQDIFPCQDQPSFNLGSGPQYYKIKEVRCKDL